MVSVRQVEVPTALTLLICEKCGHSSELGRWPMVDFGSNQYAGLSVFGVAGSCLDWITLVASQKMYSFSFDVLCCYEKRLLAVSYLWRFYSTSGVASVSWSELRSFVDWRYVVDR